MTSAGIAPPAIALIAAMVTPALLILGAASLVASALVRMARVVDRTRMLATMAYEGTSEKSGTTSAQLTAWLERHAERARYTEWSIILLYAAIVVFIATCLSIALDRIAGQWLGWLPMVLAIAGTLLLLGGGALMVAESRLSSAQITEEIRNTLRSLQGRKS